MYNSYIVDPQDCMDSIGQMLVGHFDEKKLKKYLKVDVVSKKRKQSTENTETTKKKKVETEQKDSDKEKKKVRTGGKSIPKQSDESDKVKKVWKKCHQ